MNTLLKSICTLFFIMAFTTISHGQTNKREKIEQLKIAFITSELELTSEEAQKFWPLYNEMEAKLKTEKKVQRKLDKDLRENFATLSDAENKTKVTSMFESEQKEIQIKQTYFIKIGDQIGIKKATKLLSLEQKFKRELMQSLRNDKKGDKHLEGVLGK